MNSAYSLFKRPATINGEPFRDTQVTCEFRRTLRENIIAHIDAQTPTPAAIPRQLIADKGSFDGGVRYVWMIYSGIASHWQLLIGYSLVRNGSNIIVGRITFRAALPERRINVDRVIIDSGVKRSVPVVGNALGLKIDGTRTAGRINQRRVGLNAEPYSIRSFRSATFNADSYSRCFRYLDCFNGGELRPFTGCRSGRPCQQPRNVWQVGRHRRQLMSPTTIPKAVYLSIQLDRKTDFARQELPLTVTALAIITGCHGTVCGTQTKQGGCLYEQPEVRMNGQVAERLCATLMGNSDVENSTRVRIPPCPPIWQKPGIGIAAVSPVPKREIRKGEGTDYPYQ